MKRIKALNTIVRVLKDWEGSQLNLQCAKEVLKALEDLGMKPPLNKELSNDFPDIPLESLHVWDKKDR